MEIEQSAFVLHSRSYRETSAIVTFLTPEYGKINGVVKGVRGSSKTSSQKAAAIQPFQKVNVQWREKKASSSDLISIRQFESLPVRFPLQSSANICGLYINELLYKLLFPHVQADKLFESYQHALYALLKSQTLEQQAWALRQFEAELLAEMGHALLTEYDVNQAPIEVGVEYYYYPNMGAIPALQDRVKQGVLINGGCLKALADNRYDEACLASLKKLFRILLAEYLGGKQIKTRELFR